MQVHEACTRSSLRTVCNLAAPSYPADIWPLFARMLACNPAERCTLAEAASAFDALFGCNHGPELARLRADVTRLSIDNSKLSEQAARTAEETSRLITGVCCPPPPDFFQHDFTKAMVADNARLSGQVAELSSELSAKTRELVRFVRFFRVGTVKY